MFRFSNSKAAPPGDQFVNHQDRTSDPPPLPAFRAFKMAAVGDDPKIQGNPSIVVATSSEPFSSKSFTDDTSPPSSSGDVRKNGTLPTKVGIHHQWLAQIQLAVRSASGRYRKQRKAASIDNQQHQSMAKAMAASSSLDRAVLKNRKHKTVTLTKADCLTTGGNSGLNDDVIRSHANQYYTVTEGSRGVIVEVVPTETRNSVLTSLPPKVINGPTTNDVSNYRMTMVAEAGTQSVSRDPSPMTSSGYASDGIYACHRQEKIDDSSNQKEHTAPRGKELQAAEVPLTTSGYHSSTVLPIPTSVTAKRNTGNTNDLGHTRNYRREISALEADNLPTSGQTSPSTSAADGCRAKYNEATKFRRKPVYDILSNQTRGSMEERKLNDVGSNRRYSIQPGSLQHKTTLLELRRMSMGPYLQPSLVDDNLRPASRDDWLLQGAQSAIDDDAVIYENDNVTSRPSLGNKGNVSGAFDHTVVLSPVYENDLSTTLVLDDSTVDQSHHHQQSFQHAGSRLAESSVATDNCSAQLSFHAAPDRSLVTTSFRFMSPLPLPNFDADENPDERAADWDDRLSTLSLGCRRKNKHIIRQEAEAPHELMTSHYDEYGSGNEQSSNSYMNLPRRDRPTNGARRGQTTECLAMKHDGVRRQRNRSRRRRLLFGARMLPSDLTVESVDADIQPIDRQLVEHRLRQPITNRMLSVSEEQWNSWRKAALWVEATSESRQSRESVQSDDNIYESIGDVAGKFCNQPSVGKFEQHVYNNISGLLSELPVQTGRQYALSSPPPLPPPPVPSRPRTVLQSKKITPSSSLPSLYELPLCPTEIVDLDSDHIYTIADVLASFRALAAHLPRAERFVAELQASARASAALRQRRHDDGDGNDVIADGDRRDRVPVSTRSRHRPRHARQLAVERAQNSKSASVAPGETSSTAYFRSRSAEGGSRNGNCSRPSPSASSKLMTLSSCNDGDSSRVAALSSSVSDGRQTAYRRSFRSTTAAQFPHPSGTNTSQFSQPLRAHTSFDDNCNHARHSTHVDLVCSPGNWLNSNKHKVVDSRVRNMSTHPMRSAQPEVDKPGIVEHRPPTKVAERNNDISGFWPTRRLVEISNDDENKENKEININGRSSMNVNNCPGAGNFVRRTIASSSLRCSTKYRKSRDAGRLNVSAVSRIDWITPLESSIVSGVRSISGQTGSENTDREMNDRNRQISKSFQVLPANVGRHLETSYLYCSQPQTNQDITRVLSKCKSTGLSDSGDFKLMAETVNSYPSDIAARCATFIVDDVRKPNSSGMNDAKRSGNRMFAFEIDLKEDSVDKIQRQRLVGTPLSMVSSERDLETSVDLPTTSGGDRIISTLNREGVNGSEHRSSRAAQTTHIRWAHGSNSHREIFC